MTVRIAALLSLVLLAGPARAERPLDLVLAIDTTGSMGGLIERAKAELWGIVDQLAAARLQAQTTSEIRVGLVAYRDRGDAYVTEVFDLTGDIDAAYGKLTGFEAGGGGDGPESVNAGLYDAVHAMTWGAANVQRTIILAGDAPPHMDYEDDVPWMETAEAARFQGITIHAIQCGRAAQTRDVWKAIAQAGGGTYAALPSSPTAATTSPWDAQLAGLNRALASTLVPYGDASKRDALADAAKHSAAAGDAAGAARASYLGRLGTATTTDGGDLLAKLGGGELDWDEVDAGQLPEELRELSEEERRQRLEDELDRRRGLLSEVSFYSVKRDEYLDAQRKKSPEDAFQRQVLDALGDEP